MMVKSEKICVTETPEDIVAICRDLYVRIALIQNPPMVRSIGGNFYILKHHLHTAYSMLYCIQKGARTLSRKKRKRNGGNKQELVQGINLVTAILNLVIAILLMIEKLTRYRQGKKFPLRLKNTTRKTQCQMDMDALYFILCGVSITLSVIGIVIQIKNIIRSKRK